LIGIFGRRRKIVNCVSRLNTNFDAKIKKFDRAHSKNENI